MSTETTDAGNPLDETRLKDESAFQTRITPQVAELPMARPGDDELRWLCRHPDHSLIMVELEGAYIPMIVNADGQGPVIPSEKDTVTDSTLTLPKALARIEAAKRRIGDLKAVHSRWKDGRSEFSEPDQVISEMEDLAYSVWLYLDGQAGRYLSEEDAGERE